MAREAIKGKMKTLAESYIGQKINFLEKDNLVQSELCLVRASLEELKRNAVSFLHRKELDYFNTLTFERRQLSYLLGRFAAKHAVTQYKKEISPTDILIEYGVFQYPLVQLPDKDKIQVSYSHSEESSIALAFPESFPLGIDLEAIDESRNDTIESQLTADEISLVEKLNDHDRSRSLTLIWTIKEALSKVLRTGMMTPFEIYSILNIKFENNQWLSEFKNFGQYQAISFQLGKFMCSIVYSKAFKLDIDVSKLKQWFENEKHL